MAKKEEAMIFILNVLAVQWNKLYNPVRMNAEAFQK